MISSGEESDSEHSERDFEDVGQAGPAYRKSAVKSPRPVGSESAIQGAEIGQIPQHASTPQKVSEKTKGKQPASEITSSQVLAQQNSQVPKSRAHFQAVESQIDGPASAHNSPAKLKDLASQGESSTQTHDSLQEVAPPSSQPRGQVISQWQKNNLSGEAETEGSSESENDDEQGESESVEGPENATGDVGGESEDAPSDSEAEEEKEEEEEDPRDTQAQLDDQLTSSPPKQSYPVAVVHQKAMPKHATKTEQLKSRSENIPSLTRFAEEARRNREARAEEAKARGLEKAMKERAKQPTQSEESEDDYSDGSSDDDDDSADDLDIPNRRRTMVNGARASQGDPNSQESEQIRQSFMSQINELGEPSAPPAIRPGQKPKSYGNGNSYQVSSTQKPKEGNKIGFAKLAKQFQRKQK